MKILNLLSELEVIMAQGDEHLFIANSEPLIRLILKSILTQLMDTECFKICKDKEKMIAAKNKD